MHVNALRTLYLHFIYLYIMRDALQEVRTGAHMARYSVLATPRTYLSGKPVSRSFQCTRAGFMLLMLSPLKLHKPCASMCAVKCEDDTSAMSRLRLSLEVDDWKEAGIPAEKHRTIARVSKVREASVHCIRQAGKRDQSALPGRASLVNMRGRPSCTRAAASV